MQILPEQAPVQVNLNIFIGSRYHAAHVIYHKDRYTHASPLLNDMKVLNVFKVNIFNILFYV